jgi:DNA (cytosine-5)-methyltransferase 1
MGYWRAGFDVVGVDLHHQPNYPFPFHLADALEFPLDGFDAYHASPPCQMFSILTECRPGLAEDHEGLISPTRTRLERTGRPYVIENVAGAPVRPDLLLCGKMFGHQLYRHRLFESNVPMLEPDHPAHDLPTCKVGYWEPGTVMIVAGHPTPVAHARKIMAISWTTRDELAQAIPPYFTEYIGKFLLKAVNGEVGLSERTFAQDLAEMTAEVPDLVPATTRLLPFRWEDVRRPPKPGVPRAAMAPTESAVLFAVIRQERPTIRSVADVTKLSTSQVHFRLRQLRDRGLVVWTEGAAGTLRSNVGFVVAPSPDRT